MWEAESERWVGLAQRKPTPTSCLGMWRVEAQAEEGAFPGVTQE